MRRLKQPRHLRKSGASSVHFHPVLESIEERVLPGDTVGAIWWTSLDFVRDLVTPAWTGDEVRPAPAATGEAFAIDPAAGLTSPTWNEDPVRAAATMRREHVSTQDSSS